MKVALTLLIVGVLLAAIGVGLWVYSNDVLDIKDGYWRDNAAYGHYKANKAIEGAAGAGLAVIGGSMAVAGGVMMIVKREDKSK